MRRFARIGTILQFKKRGKHQRRSVALACNFSKSSTPSWVFFVFFKWCQSYQIVQSITYLKIYLYNC